MFLKCHSERGTSEESPKPLFAAHPTGDSSLPLVAQSDMDRLILQQPRFKKHFLIIQYFYARHNREVNP